MDSKQIYSGKPLTTGIMEPSLRGSEKGRKPQTSLFFSEVQPIYGRGHKESDTCDSLREDLTAHKDPS